MDENKNVEYGAEQIQILEGLDAKKKTWYVYWKYLSQRLTSFSV